MKAAQLEVGKFYIGKKNVVREVRQITGKDSAFPYQVFYCEDHFIYHIPIQDFAKWAKTTCAKPAMKINYPEGNKYVPH